MIAPWLLIIITLSAGAPQVDSYPRESGALCRRQAVNYTAAGFMALCLRNHGRGQ